MNDWKKILKKFDIDGTPVEISRMETPSDAAGLGNTETWKLRTLETAKPNYLVHCTKNATGDPQWRISKFPEQ